MFDIEAGIGIRIRIANKKIRNRIHTQYITHTFINIFYKAKKGRRKKNVMKKGILPKASETAFIIVVEALKRISIRKEYIYLE